MMLLPTKILEGELNPFGLRVINSLMPAHAFLIFLLLAMK